MKPTTRADEQRSETESKFYIPAASTPSSATGWAESLWAKLFSHGIETPR
jgi:hypothetical protein